MPASIGPAPISDAAFTAIRDLLFRVAGIHLAPGKKALMGGRLNKRLRQLGLQRFEDYQQRVLQDPVEQQIAIDLLTTNETQFFRERAHFDLLRERILPELRGRRPLRAWSAAASTGQEAYSLAMMLAHHAGHAQWEVLGSDISARVLETARAGRYDLRHADQIPLELRRAYCLRGVGSQAGVLLIDEALRRHVRFQQINLNATLPEIGRFDLILLRNVMIYFPNEVKRGVVARIAQRLAPGGWLLIGHSESIADCASDLECVAPSVYRQP